MALEAPAEKEERALINGRTYCGYALDAPEAVPYTPLPPPDVFTVLSLVMRLLQKLNQKKNAKENEKKSKIKAEKSRN